MNKPAPLMQRALDDSQEAILSYLDQLLGEIPEHIPEQTAEQVSEQVAITEMPAALLTTERQVEADIPVTGLAQGGTEVDTSAGQSVDIAVSAERGIPEFAQQPFQCLIFDLAGLNMAIPLERLNGIVEIQEGITPMPGHSPWFLGLLPERGMQIKIIDTAQLVVPAKYRQAQTQDTLQKAILIHDSEWGLACNQVKEVITLDKDAVRWRKAAGTRPWLLGTVIDQMCALLDADEFAAMLASDNCQVLA